MTQLTINVEDKSILPHLKKILNAIEGVSIAKPSRKKKCGLECSLFNLIKSLKNISLCESMLKVNTL